MLNTPPPPAVKTGSTKNHIVLDFATLSAALRLWAPFPDGRTRSAMAAAFHEAFRAAGVSLEIQVQGRPVLSFGGDSLSGPALALLTSASNG